MAFKTSHRAVTSQRPLVVALAGGTGLEVGVRLLERLAALGMEAHLVIDRAAARGLGVDASRVRSLAAKTYAEGNQAARISSGSFLTGGMVVAPCDAAPVSAIVLGLATNLVYRAADVTLKERRPLVLGLASGVLERLTEDVAARAAGVPGLSLLPLPESTDAAVGLLLAQVGVEPAFAEV